MEEESGRYTFSTIPMLKEQVQVAIDEYYCCFQKDLELEGHGGNIICGCHGPGAHWLVNFLDPST